MLTSPQNDSYHLKLCYLTCTLITNLHSKLHVVCSEMVERVSQDEWPKVHVVALQKNIMFGTLRENLWGDFLQLVFEISYKLLNYLIIE